MPLYRYEALDRTGNPVVGAMQVPDEQTLNTRLLAMGYRPTTVQMAQSGGARTLQPAASPYTAAPAVGTSRLSANERALARTFHQLYIAFRAGMPAFQAVSTVATQVAHPAIRQALTEISLSIRDGHSLSQLMERYPRLFSRGDVGMVRAAEMGGFLPDAFEALATRHEEDDKTRRRLQIWAWGLHVNVVLLAVIIAASFFFYAGFSTMDPGAGLAAVRKAFLTISLPMLVGYFGLLTWFNWARHSPSLATRWHRFLLRLPMLGRVNRLRANAVFARTLQQLSYAGLPASTAWDTAAGAVPNLFLGDQLAAALPTVNATSRFSPAMQQTGHFDAADVGMVATGESTGEISQALEYLANRYAEDTRVALGATVVRGAMTLVSWMFILVGFALIALAQGYYGQIIPAVEKFMGTGE